MGKKWLVLALLCLICSTARSEAPLESQSFELALPADPMGWNALLEEALDQSQIDRVEFKNVTWKFVNDFLEAKYSTGRSGWGRPVYIKLYASTSKTISLSLSKVSCRTVIAAACQETGAHYAVNGEAVVILPDDAAIKDYLADFNFRARLQSIIIPKFFDDPIDGTNIGRIAQYLTAESKRADPTHRGITISIDLPPHWREPKSPSDRVTPIHRETSSWGDLPLSEILGYIISGTDLTYTYDPKQNAVILRMPKENVAVPSHP